MNETAWYEEQEASYVQAFKDRPAYYFGAIILACVADNMLMGLLAAQTWTYFKWFQDGRRYKALVALLFLLNVGQSATVISYVYLKFGVQYGQYKEFTTGLFVDLAWLFEGLAGALAQLYFLEKAYRLSKRNKLLLIANLIPIVGALAAGMSALIWLVGVLGGDAVYNDRVLPLILAFKALTAVVDFSLTATIIYYLLRSKSGWKKTDKAVESFLRFIAEAQVLPLLASLAFLASFAADPGGSYPALFSWVDTKVYAISVCHVLNSRGTLRREFFTSAHSAGAIEAQSQHRDGVGKTTIGGSPFYSSSSSAPAAGHSYPPSPSGIPIKGIQVHTATHVVSSSLVGVDVDDERRSGEFAVRQLQRHGEGRAGMPPRTSSRPADDAEAISLESFERADDEKRSERTFDDADADDDVFGVGETELGTEQPGGSQARLVPTLHFSSA